MLKTLQKGICILVATLLFSAAQAQTQTYNTVATFTVPSGVSYIKIAAYGGAGGFGGKNCPNGCSVTNPGFAGEVIVTYNVVPGDVIGIYPGGKGTNGLDNVTNRGGGAAGVATYTATNYNGGKGGNAGIRGKSGGGGGGGAATIVTINGNVQIVASGGGGGGGMADVANSGINGLNIYASNGTTFGGEGAFPPGPGGGGGGGGAGQFGGLGGDVFKVSEQYSGSGGYSGNNFIAGTYIVSSDLLTYSENAGSVTITYSRVLPVTYLSFTGNITNNKVLLNWSTASEHNSANFEIQRSNDNKDWQNIGLLSAAGNSNIVKYYSFMDEEPINGINYYRLVQNDFDGNQTISRIVSVNFKNKVSLLKIFPNPVLNGSLKLTVSKAATVYIFSNSGTKLLEKTLKEGQHSIDVSKFAKGNYFIKLDAQTEGFIIQ